MRNAYYCAVADIVHCHGSHPARKWHCRVSVIFGAFPLVPELDSAQFSASVASHRRAAQDRTPLRPLISAPSATARAGGSLVGATPRPFGMHKTRSLPLPNSETPYLLEPHTLSATDAFPDMTPADQRHTQVVLGDHFSDIDEDEQDDEATSQSLIMGMEDEAQPRASGVLVTHGMCDDTAVHITADAAAPGVGTGIVLSTTGPHRDTRARSYSAPRLSMATLPTAGQSTQTATPAATHLAAPSPLGMARDTDDIWRRYAPAQFAGKTESRLCSAMFRWPNSTRSATRPSE